MEVSPWVLGVLLGSALLAAIDASPASSLYEIDLCELARVWERDRVSPPDPYSLKHPEVQRHLRLLAEEFPSVTRIEKAGSSTEGREIQLLSLGNGERKIMLWSQMHGDEPTATNALLDLARFLGKHRQESWVADILSKYTLLLVPMLNPDGAERGQRRNAQGLDINRDARVLQSPEGRLLKNLRDRYQPFLGFNLHNQNSLTTVGDTGNVATIALLAVASEVPTTDPASKILAKQVAAVLQEALSPFIEGHISRYDESYNPRAFGDNLSNWGTPVVLIESGGNPAGQAADFGVKLNFVGLLATLNSLASGKIQNANPAVFDALKMNSDTPIFDLLLHNAWICTGTGVPLFRGDAAIRRDVRAGSGGDSLIADLGDLGVYTAHETIDCSGLMLSPGLIAWDPQLSLFSEKKPDASYLERGIITLLETVLWADLQSRSNEGEWKGQLRGINWSFLVNGEPRKGKSNGLLLAQWLIAGGRGWVRGQKAHDFKMREVETIPGWFGLETFQPEAAARFRVPFALEGDPAKVLPRWTSEAARRFRIPRRGTVSVGSAADLVLWKAPSGEAPANLRDCHPVQLIVNGHRVDLTSPGTHGRFLGRP